MGETRRTFCGTYEYMAPEIITGKPQTKAVDIWSLGVLLYELFEGKSPYKGKNVNKIYKKIMEQKITFSTSSNPELISLILQMLTVKVQKRPDINQLVAHPFFAKAKGKNLAFKEERKTHKNSPCNDASKIYDIQTPLFEYHGTEAKNVKESMLSSKQERE